jgi:hypothetical protein
MEHQNFFAIQFELANKQKAALLIRWPYHVVLGSGFVLPL